MDVTRRTFVAGLSATALAFAGLKLLRGGAAGAQPAIDGYGPLVPDPARLLDLPQGFAYRIVSREGEPMSDGLMTPAAFDGMACFPVRGAPGRVALVRNHEMWPNLTEGGAFGADHALARNIPRDMIFDFAADGAPKLGGTTTLIWDMRRQRLLRSHLSLAGTCGNCAGGPTPWGSWLTCEETLEKAAPLASRAHGWVFEVPSSARGLVAPVPLTAMGRFIHEAAAVDDRTGVVYLTEDRPDSLLYRFLPNERGRLARGGRLQALALLDGRERDLRNWPADGSRFAGQGRRSPSAARRACGGSISTASNRPTATSRTGVSPRERFASRAARASPWAAAAAAAKSISAARWAGRPVSARCGATGRAPAKAGTKRAGRGDWSCSSKPNPPIGSRIATMSSSRPGAA